MDSSELLEAWMALHIEVTLRFNAPNWSEKVARNARYDFRYHLHLTAILPVTRTFWRKNVLEAQFKESCDRLHKIGNKRYLTPMNNRLLILSNKFLAYPLECRSTASASAADRRWGGPRRRGATPCPRTRQPRCRWGGPDRERRKKLDTWHHFTFILDAELLYFYGTCALDSLEMK